MRLELTPMPPCSYERFCRAQLPDRLSEGQSQHGNPGLLIWSAMCSFTTMEDHNVITLRRMLISHLGGESKLMRIICFSGR